MDMDQIRLAIESGKTALGIELGSTRIKAVLVDERHEPIASGGHDWENKLENGFWTYSLEDVWKGMRDCYAKLRANVREKYGADLTRVSAIGVSAMMHGYLAFDASGNLLAPFRTWRNTTTGPAAAELTALLGFNIPLRWSIAHLYQGHPERRGARGQDRLCHHAGGLRPLEADRRKGAGRGRRLGHVPHRQRDL